jgi:hypothetical protein
MESRTEIRNRLKHTIEANRISRLSQPAQDEILKDRKQKQKDGNRNASTLIGIIEERREMSENARVNRTFAEYGGGADNGGGGSGHDSG